MADCDCIDIQLRNSPPVKMCSNNLGELFLGILAVVVIKTVFDKLSE